MSKINNEIEKTMDLLDDIEKISPDPLFYDDLMNRIKSLDIEPSGKKLYFYRNYKNVLFILLILVNLFTLIYFYSASRRAIKDENLISTAKVYHINQSNYNLLTFNE